MTARTVQRSRFVPILYPGLALVVAALLLPSALRPPPEQTSDSAALNPNAPPDDQQEQIIQALQQAEGGGAGASETETTSTTTPPNRPPASGRCFGNPARQIESVYSAPCAPAFTGSNGGVTGHNVFPNEIRLGFQHTTGAPPEGPVDQGGTANGAKRTFRVLQDYFNKRFQTYGRKVRFWGVQGSTDAAANQAEAKKANEEFKLFGANHLDRQFCLTFARDAGPVFCNPSPADVYKQNRPNYYSFMIDRTAAAGFGAEFACKKLVGKKALFSGTEKNKMRKISIVTENGPGLGMPPSVYENALQKECGATYGGRSYELNGGSDVNGAAAAVLQMQASGVTSIVVETNIINALYLFVAAESVGWEPEWIIISAFGLDFNIAGTVLPANQSRHMFGLSAWEVPRRFEETECFQAYKEIDPDNEPDSTTCHLFWHPLVLFMDGIQEAGPRLNAKSFEQGLFKLGHRFPVEPWAVGGGFGLDDYSYMDNVGEVWFSHAAQNPENGAPGAFVWSYGAKRFKRGELPVDDGQLFAHGVTTPGGPDEHR